MPRRVLSREEYDAVTQALLASAPKGLSEAQYNAWIGPAFAKAIIKAEQIPVVPLIGAVPKAAEAVTAIEDATGAKETFPQRMADMASKLPRSLQRPAAMAATALPDLAQIAAVASMGPAAMRAAPVMAQGVNATGRLASEFDITKPAKIIGDLLQRLTKAKPSVPEDIPGFARYGPNIGTPAVPGTAVAQPVPYNVPTPATPASPPLDVASLLNGAI